MSLSRAIATVGGLTMLSRVFGFARDLLTAMILGAGPMADAFFVALKLPNFFRRLFAEGAFSAAFVPMVSEKIEIEGKQAGKAMAERAMAIMIAFLIPFVLLGLLFMPALVTVLAPGFIDEPQKFQAAIDLARITFPYLLLISVTALLGGLLNSMGRFAPFAAAPIIFNLTLIGGLGYAQYAGTSPADAMAWAVSVAGILQLAFLLWFTHRLGILPHLIRPSLSPDMKKLLRLMVPGIIGGGVMQINLMIDTILASLLASGAISWLFYADRMYQLPLGVIGIAIGTALLPGLSRAMSAGREKEAMHLLSRALEYGLLLALPSALGLGIIAEQIIGGLFQYGRFDDFDTAQTAMALSAYALGIPAYVGVKVLNAAYFARQDTASPVRIAILCTAINTCGSLLLIQPLGHAGIALATGITAWLNLALLVRGLRKRGQFNLDQRFIIRLPRIIGAGAVMALLLAAILLVTGPMVLDLNFGADPVMRVIWMLALIGLGAIGFTIAAILFGAGKIREITAGLGTPKPPAA
ncbi:MAG TPA: murein biosynthesis integral membrane protein MurJ [Rhodospirillaceae bacterium]|nr:murein biosynthesis integral membrane protein MurJ [Alphaproteobacteria bacterium]MAS47588.1 murein biosynthesis integral membrane protein MurJ [Alphaproteobacteria bacterium]MBN52105.1 murein biosynthesis integral membrane protein MurJ [Alphaproteobacteria bacterium]OUT40927.1 MAG: murein biosynthesis integral membrane protein MurJ [Micavibrio sp. TMED2]HCI47947.1 murein biosynthesis integral membrane protein MurJ [Rhodospirillaceae bacterium]|tara:strand:- start:11229 stop:12803 length:1575 start_codon:yes stop_codon:yes gene_type:complete